MRLGLAISGHRPAPDAVAVARAAEAHGLAQVWLTEDYCERGAFALAGAVAAATGRVQVGLGVVNPWTRHPMLLAMEHAALDELAGGRAVLGLGASNARWMQEQLGIPFQRPLPRLRETVTLLRAALAGEPVDHHGEAFQVNARLAFTPPRPRSPIVLGVKGRRGLRLAGEVADGALLSVLSAPAYVAWARQQTGDRVELAAYAAFSCDPDAAAARDRIRRMVATFLGVHGVHDITRVAGLPEDLALRFRDGWRHNRPAVELATDELLATFAIAGNPDDCAAAIQRLAAAGLDTLILHDPGHGDPTSLLPAATTAWHRATEVNQSDQAGGAIQRQP